MGIIYGNTIRVTKGDTRSLDNGTNGPRKKPCERFCKLELALFAAEHRVAHGARARVSRVLGLVLGLMASVSGCKDLVKPAGLSNSRALGFAEAQSLKIYVPMPAEGSLRL